MKVNNYKYNLDLRVQDIIALQTNAGCYRSVSLSGLSTE